VPRDFVINYLVWPAGPDGWTMNITDLHDSVLGVLGYVAPKKNGGNR